MKKAETKWSNVLIVLILLIVAIFIGAYLLTELGKTESVDVEDKLCRQANQLRSTTTTPGLGEVRPGEAVPKSPRLCIIQYETIDASNYEACNMETEIMTIAGLKECAAHQIAQLAWRCWWMGGEGQWGQVGSWKCFTGKIVMNQYETAESYAKVLDSFKRQLREQFDCYSKDRLTKGYAADCEALAADITDKLILKLAHNTRINFYRDVDEEGYASSIADAQNTIKELNEDISNLLHSNLKDPDKIIEIKVCEEYDAEGECTSEVTKDVSVIDSTFESALIIGSSLPDIGSIKESDIKGALKTKNITTENRPYKTSFPSDKFEVLGEFEINPNSLFEIGFCDPPLELGSGPLTQMECKITTGQQIQLGAGGTVGVSREGSPYCNVFNALNQLPILKEMQNYCKVSSKS